MEQIKSILSELSHLDLEGQIVDKQAHASGFGSSCDVYSAWSIKHNKKVAVKQIRVFLTKQQAFAKRIAREIRIWTALDHKNVLPLLGFVVEGQAMTPSFISEWMEHGTLHDFMKTFPRCSKETCTMLVGIASGLFYLHSKGIIHADLKSQNVLISASKQPLLADFGLSVVLSHSQCTTGTSSLTRGTVRWMARELFVTPDNDSPKYYAMSDIWSLGMVTYELLTWDVPYRNKKADTFVLMAILAGELPEKPEDISDESNVFRGLWDFCILCWSDVASRPIAFKCMAILSSIEAKARNDSGGESVASGSTATSNEHRASNRGELDDSLAIGVSSFDVPRGAYMSLWRIFVEFQDAIYSDTIPPGGLNDAARLRSASIEHEEKLNIWYANWIEKVAEGPDSRGTGGIVRTSLIRFLVNYIRLVIFSVGFQHTSKHGFQPDYAIYFEKCVSSAHTVLQCALDFLAPRGYFNHAPGMTSIILVGTIPTVLNEILVEHLDFASSTTAFLMKFRQPEFLKLTPTADSNRIFALVEEVLKIFASSSGLIVDGDNRILHNRFLDGLLERSSGSEEGESSGRVHLEQHWRLDRLIPTLKSKTSQGDGRQEVLKHSPSGNDTPSTSIATQDEFEFSSQIRLALDSSLKALDARESPPNEDLDLQARQELSPSSPDAMDWAPTDDETNTTRAEGGRAGPSDLEDDDELASHVATMAKIHFLGDLHWSLPGGTW